MSSDLTAALDHPLFVGVDLHLRAGGHLDASDLARFSYVREHEIALEYFYEKYHCDLVRSTEDYYYLRPRGDLLRQRALTVAEMYVGMVLCLFYLDPGVRAGTGAVTEDQVFEQLSTLLGRRRLTRTLQQQRRRENAIAEEGKNRAYLRSALRTLRRLGFVEHQRGGKLIPRPSLMRFAEPVHGQADLAYGLERLVRTGDVVRSDQEDALELGETEESEE